jgi:hypothetical protein
LDQQKWGWTPKSKIGILIWMRPTGVTLTRNSDFPARWLTSLRASPARASPVPHSTASLARRQWWQQNTMAHQCAVISRSSKQKLGYQMVSFSNFCFFKKLTYY